MKSELLPTTKHYRCVDEALADSTISAIRRKFDSVLESGVQRRGLPDDMLAAGQYLDRFEFEQRGLFGTAAAILVISSTPHVDNGVQKLQSLVNYLRHRETLEPNLAQDPEEAIETSRRIAVERLDTFKTADVVFALSRVPVIVLGRDTHLQALIQRVIAARLSGGGWATRLDNTGSFDPLATAHTLRALTAASVPVNENDVAALLRHLDSSSIDENPYARIFALTVIATIRLKTRREFLEEEHRRLVGTLRTQMSSPAEANYEYTAGRRQYYVRIPWQLYLIELTLRLFPSTKFFSFLWQQHLLMTTKMIDSPTGFTYRSSGEAQSTRTHGITCELMRLISASLDAAPRMRFVGTTINTATRVAYSRVTNFVLWLAAAAMIGYTVLTWALSNQHSVLELAPNFLATMVLVLLQVALARIRK
ncbi:hypothetical protein [Amycolatopsis sp. NBC_00438]|uniref:hypothetical protein n=1 Tax=Amycolatopsis sp. NBC_00438 TaxID=2903558 RepID=UPI002E22A3CB